MNPVLELSRLAARLGPTQPGPTRDPSAGLPGPFLEAARNWLLEFDLGHFLQACEWGRELHQRVTGQIHLGFVVYPSWQAGWSEHLQRAEFRAEAPFSSQVLAREMSSWYQDRPVECRVWRAWCAPGRGLECFFPQLPDSEVEPWIVAGRGRHLGLELKDSRSLLKALEGCRREGFRVPDFLAGQPALNSNQGIQLVYADGSWEGLPLRLEFYCCDARYSASA